MFQFEQNPVPGKKLGVNDGRSNRIADFLSALQSNPATQNGVGVFDSLLNTVTGSGPVVGPAVNDVLLRAMSTIGPVERKANILGEIDRQLFLQFLEGEVAYLKAHRNLDSLLLFQRVDHDRQVCRTKQQQIRAALNRLLDTMKIDNALSTALAAQRAKTFTTFLDMIASDDIAYTPTIDDFINVRENASIRKILEQLTESWAQDGTPFVAQDGWTDLKEHWGAWASKHRNRVAALKKFWMSSGGGKDVDSNPAAIGVIKDYYHELHDVIAGGDLAALVQKLDATP